MAEAPAGRCLQKTHLPRTKHTLRTTKVRHRYHSLLCCLTRESCHRRPCPSARLGLIIAVNPYRPFKVDINETTEAARQAKKTGPEFGRVVVVVGVARCVTLSIRRGHIFFMIEFVFLTDECILTAAVAVVVDGAHGVFLSCIMFLVCVFVLLFGRID
jgi:hypothetical protein